MAGLPVAITSLVRLLRGCSPPPTCRRIVLDPVLCLQTCNPAELAGVVRHQPAFVGDNCGREHKIVRADALTIALQIRSDLGVVVGSTRAEGNDLVRCEERGHSRRGPLSDLAL